MTQVNHALHWTFVSDSRCSAADNAFTRRYQLQGTVNAFKPGVAPQNFNADLLLDVGAQYTGYSRTGYASN